MLHVHTVQVLGQRFRDVRTMLSQKCQKLYKMQTEKDNILIDFVTPIVCLYRTSLR